MNEVTFQKGLHAPVDPQNGPLAPGGSSAVSFGDMLDRSLNEVNQLHAAADEAVKNFANGQQQDIHQTMIAMEKADVAFQLLMQVRNKIIAAYETIMRMQV